MKINIPLIVILLTLFVVNLINITSIPLDNTINYVYLDNPNSVLISISDTDKLMYILCFFLMLINIYMSINYMLYRIHFKKSFAWLCCIIIIAALVFLIYSYIVEAETYKLFIENMGTVLRQYNPKSFTNNTNSFAAIILGGAFCSYAMYAVTNKPFFFLLGLFFCVNVVFPMSRICLVLSLALTLLIFAYKMFITWKGHAFRNINLIFLVTIFIAISALIMTNVTEVKEYIENVVFTNDSSINSRTPLWSLSISMVNHSHRFIGLGHGYFNTAFATILEGTLKMPHNLYVQTYGALGILGLIFLGVLICFILYRIFRLYKNNREAALVSIIGLFIVLTYYLVEG